MGKEINYNMLAYFWQEKRCLECWASWNEQRKLIQKKHPDLIKNYQEMKRAQANFRRNIEEVLEQAQDEGWYD